jgi:hypothetical protein
MAVKFHKKALAIFACAQIAEGNKVNKTSAEITGTATAATDSTTFTGVGTKFLTELTPGAYIYSADGATRIGRVKTVASDTAATLYANAENALAGADFSTGLGPANAVAVLNLNYSTELESEAFQYTGDELDRDETTVIKDKYAKFDFETFVPSLGTIAGDDPTVYEVPMVDFFGAAGMALVLSTDSSGTATFTNSEASNEYLTVEIRRSSPDIPNDQKTFITSDCRGSIDFSGVVGTKGKLKWNFMGNLVSVVDKDKITPDFGDQKTEIAGSFKSTTIVTSQLDLYSGEIEPTYTATTKNVCFQKLEAPNFTGFDYSRYQTGCIDGWSKGAVPSDVTLTILEDKASATYNPDDHIEKLHGLYIDYGTTTGKKVGLRFHKMQLAGITNSEVAEYAGQDLKFRNVGYSDLILS